MGYFSKVATEVLNGFKYRLSADRDAEWQRVNSYIADTLKDAHVLYAKLARLQGDFAGAELDQLQKISEAVLVLGDELSVFSKDFYEGKYQMQQSEFIYGDKGGSPVPNPEVAPKTPPASPVAIPPVPEEKEETPKPPPPDDGTFDVPVKVEGEEDTEEAEDTKEEK